MGKDIRIPTKEEIAQLPRWAQVAFAARCARRVQPLFTFYWPGAPKEDINAIDKAIALAEKSAAVAAHSHIITSAIEAACHRSAEVIGHVIGATGRVTGADTAHWLADVMAVITAANFAARAARAADYAGCAYTDFTEANAASNCPMSPLRLKGAYTDFTEANTASAIRDATDAATAAAHCADSYAQKKGFQYELWGSCAIRNDFDKLLTSAKEKNWNNRKSVLPEFFGPMWTDGAPTGWPEMKEKEHMSIWKRLFGKSEQSREQPKLEYYAISAENPKAKKSIELVERYITMEHPRDPGLAALGLPATKPEYRPAPGGGVSRGNHIHIDMKIVSVAACLKGGTVKGYDVDDHNRKAMAAIEHYASLEKVKAFFLLPYYVRRRVVVEGRPIDPAELCRLYAGVENLLLEIYEELPEGGHITDEVVERKIDSLVSSITNA